MSDTIELFVVGAQLEGRPALFLLESGTAGVTIESEPAMGLRAASMGRLILDGATVPPGNLLGRGNDRNPDVYAECIRLARLGWASPALGTGKAVLDYVIPYVNERKAFGEPISHRQAVAFTVANIGIELEGARLVTLRAAGRAEQGKPFAYILPSVLSTRTYLKQANVACQTLLERYAEPLTALAWAQGRPYPASFMRRAWKELLKNQPHDSICGW